MPLFQYTARDPNGQKVVQLVNYSDEPALRKHLRANNLFVLEVTERKGQARRGSGRVGLADLITFCRHLRTMIAAGMPLVSALDAMASQTTSARLGQVLAEVTSEVSAGKTLSRALSAHTTVFPEVVTMLVAAGEEGGRLPETLAEASRQLEVQLDVRQKLISALMYPIFTLVLTVGVVTAMLVWIVPTFANIYKSLNAQLPGPTLALVALSGFIKAWGWLITLVIIAAVLVLKRWYKTPEGRIRLDAAKLKIPVFGNLVRKSASANLTNCLAGLLESGVPLVNALETSAQVCGNEVMSLAARAAAKNLVIGRPLSSELERSGQFPPMVTRMVALAEEVGALPEVLKQIADGYIEDVDYAVKRLLTVIEPIMVVFVGGIVGALLVAMYYPIFNMGNAFLGDG